MKHTIDLKNYPLRSDLAVDNIERSNNLKGIHQKISKVDNIKITDVKLDKVNSLHKKNGYYVTIEFEDITDSDNFGVVLKILENEFQKMLHKMNIKDYDSCLIVGLGNIKSTPDALGPQLIEKVIVTNHIYELGDLDDSYRRVSAIAPGVTGQTGIETMDIIKSIVDKIHPSFVIAVDSLASQSIERVNKTIQMTNTGIHPGSGIGNSRKELSYDTLNVPVLAIGVPTVVDASVIVADTIHYMYKHYAFIKEYQKEPKSKLTFNNINYLHKEINISNQDKEKLLGMIGKLDIDETKQLINEVLNPIGYNMMVTPKEVDFIISKLSELISISLNTVLQNKSPIK